MSAPADPQRLATDPAAHAALSASAGTGKTHILTNRVFRLLLSGAEPEHILCLTFTKAGAANMAQRIGERLAKWVRLERYELARELQELGEPGGPEQQDRARTLFAKVLDAPGGIRVMTIHAFAQSLLAAFPAEAGIPVGFEPLEGRAEQELVHRTLADMVAAADASGNRGLIDDVERLSIRVGPEGAIKYLRACARHSEALEQLDPSALESHLRAALKVPPGDVEEWLHDQCSDGKFDCDLLRAIAAANRGYTEKTGGPRAELIDQWLAAAPSDRLAMLPALLTIFLTQKGTPQVHRPRDGDYDECATRLVEAIVVLLEAQASARAAADLAASLRAGRAFASAYARSKRLAGVADFDDMIAWTRRLLDLPGIGEWVRYKLDQRIDHILVDEAQDTNADQWSIIDSLAEEFFTGASEADERQRTLLMVGDFKQAIFRFQGTDPAQFEAARQRYRGRAEAMLDAESEYDDEAPRALPFHDLEMSRSWRSAQAILDQVDAVIAHVGPEAMGLPALPAPHVAVRGDLSGTVELWSPFVVADPDDEDRVADEETWLDLKERRYAEALALEVRKLIDGKCVLDSSGRTVAPGDILILVRSRGSLASLIVARLFAQRVRVAGIDRLQLQEPLAVQDLLATLRFAAQPLDDLNLAALLVSPLFGWSQDQLLEFAARRGEKISLWRTLRDREDEAGDTVAQLRGLLAMADFESPARFLEAVLSGPIRGREKLFARLSESARDEVDELMNAALLFEREDLVSIDHFLSWFDRGAAEVTRDSAEGGDSVRVMTVHGAKGLEAPVVILADCHSDPTRRGSHDDPIMAEIDGQRVPLSRSGVKNLPAMMKEVFEADRAADLKEHWRLLYVGMTRAIDRLIIAGVEPKNGNLAELSWQRIVTDAMEEAGAEVIENGLPWGRKLRYHRPGKGRAQASPKERAIATQPTKVPEWARLDAPEELRPPKPLAPSSLGKDDAPAPLPTAAMRGAARRGILIHALLERLADVPSQHRSAAAIKWLSAPGRVDDQQEREALVAEVLAILDDPRLGPLFGPESLGEAPLAATLGDGRVIAGTVDRLLVTGTLVAVVDFKTGRVPSGAEKIPVAHRAQMDAYAEALSVIFPNREVRASLVYTAGPVLFPIRS